jgi:hypothetical protein
MHSAKSMELHGAETEKGLQSLPIGGGLEIILRQHPLVICSLITFSPLREFSSMVCLSYLIVWPLYVFGFVILASSNVHHLIVQEPLSRLYHCRRQSRRLLLHL